LLDLAAAVRALLYHGVGKLLDLLKAVTTFLAFVFIKGHGETMWGGRSFDFAQDKLCPTLALSNSSIRREPVLLPQRGKIMQPRA